MNTTCPVPISKYDQITLAHGGGGRFAQQLLKKIFFPSFDNPMLEAAHDGAVCKIFNHRIAYTTDSHVVRPLFFPGGDIGKLAVCGTVNDLAMCGAKPLYLAAGFILEEGLPIKILQSVVVSMQRACEECKVFLVTGDTKVVEKGKGDGLYITTTGIGILEHDLKIQPQSLRENDAIILSGDIGRHGIAVMSAREGLNLETTIQSDCAALHHVVLKLLEANIHIHCMRDLTRGGLATALVEIAETSHRGMLIEESKIPVSSEVQAACELLGFDPFYVANEGRFILFVPQSEAQKALKILKKNKLTKDARAIGSVAKPQVSKDVVFKNEFGSHRIIDLLSEEQLPRIC